MIKDVSFLLSFREIENYRPTHQESQFESIGNRRLGSAQPKPGSGWGNRGPAKPGARGRPNEPRGRSLDRAQIGEKRGLVRFRKRRNGAWPSTAGRAGTDVVPPWPGGRSPEATDSGTGLSKAGPTMTSSRSAAWHPHLAAKILLPRAASACGGRVPRAGDRRPTSAPEQGEARRPQDEDRRDHAPRARPRAGPSADTGGRFSRSRTSRRTAGRASTPGANGGRTGRGSGPRIVRGGRSPKRNSREARPGTRTRPSGESGDSPAVPGFGWGRPMIVNIV